MFGKSSSVLTPAQRLSHLHHDVEQFIFALERAQRVERSRVRVEKRGVGVGISRVVEFRKFTLEVVVERHADHAVGLDRVHGRARDVRRGRVRRVVVRSAHRATERAAPRRGGVAL